MTKRNAVIYYLFALLTGGQFGLLWLFLMAHDVEAGRRNHIPQLHLFSAVYVTVYAVYLALVGYNLYALSQFEPGGAALFSFAFVPFMLLSAFFLLAYATYLAVKIAQFVRASGINLVGNAGLLLLFFVCLAALPILQSKLNRAVEGRA